MARADLGSVAKELDKLFTSLATTRAPVVRPEIELARLTLSNVVAEEARRRSTLLEKRPSPPVPDENMGATEDNEDAIMITDSPKGKPEEDISMGEDGIESGIAAPQRTDVDMATTPPRPASPTDSAMGDDVPSARPAQKDGPPVPPRPQNQAPPEQQQVERWAQQQDVREVLGNVLLQLRWAIKGTKLTEKGDQIDYITESVQPGAGSRDQLLTFCSRFYGIDETVTVKPTGEERIVDQFQELMPYLGQPSDLYSILEAAYDLTAIEGTEWSTYKEIKQIPHILHISVERGRNDGTKCEEPLELPERIYMDRFMRLPHILAKRRQAWNWKAGLSDLRQRRDLLTKTITDLSIPETLTSTVEYLVEIAGAEELGVNGAAMAEPEELLAALGDSAESAQQEINELDTEISILEQKLTNLFNEDTEFAFRLHAVFVHRGGSGSVNSGHWFIYIFDPKTNQWRRYNDEDVQKVKDPNVILKPSRDQARIEGTASFVVYVADVADVPDVPGVKPEEFVQAVYREPAPEMLEIPPASTEETKPPGSPDENTLPQIAEQALDYSVPRQPLGDWDHDMHSNNDMNSSGW